MIKILLIMTTTAGVLAATDDWIRTKYHPPEQPPSQLVQQLDRTNKGSRVHLDVWILEHGPIRLACVMGPCDPRKAAGDMR